MLIAASLEGVISFLRRPEMSNPKRPAQGNRSKSVTAHVDMRWVRAKLVFIISRINTLLVTPTQSGITKQEGPSSNFQLLLVTMCTYVRAGRAFSFEFTHRALSTYKFIPPSVGIPCTSRFIHDALAIHPPTGVIRYATMPNPAMVSCSLSTVLSLLTIREWWCKVHLTERLKWSTDVLTTYVILSWHYPLAAPIVFFNYHQYFFSFDANDSKYYPELFEFFLDCGLNTAQICSSWVSWIYWKYSKLN